MARPPILVLMLLTGCGRLGFGGTDDGDGAVALDQRRSRLVLGVDPGESLVDFPLLVVLDDQRAARDLMQPDASDLRFLDGTGRVIPHQIEQLGAPGGAPLVAWVRVPRIEATATVIDIDYGHPSPPPLSTDPVWIDEFSAVWHLADLADATPHHNDGNWVGGAMTAVAGIARQTWSFVASARRAIQTPDAASLDFGVTMTVSGWMYAASRPTASGYSSIVSRQNGNATDDDFWIGFDNPTGITDAVISVPTGTQITVQNHVIPLATWTFVAITYDGAVERLYVDGIEVDTMATTGNVRHGARPVVIGGDHNSAGASPEADDDFIDGMIDEVRLQTVTRSPRWLAYDNASVRDQVITYGPVAR